MANEAKSILILDDSADLLELMTHIVKHFCNGLVVPATSLDHIIEVADSALGCDMAFLDINLGPAQPSGVDAYRWLRDKGFNKPIFFLTGHASTYPLVAEAELLGDAKVLSKPCKPEDLIAIIRGDHGT